MKASSGSRIATGRKDPGISARLTKKELLEQSGKLREENLQLAAHNEELRNSLSRMEKSWEWYADLYEFAPVGYFALEYDGLIRAVNRTGASMLSREKRDLIGKPFISFVHPEDHPAFARHSENVLRDAVPCHCELRMTGPDGSFFYARIECKAVRDKDGNLLEIRNTLSNIHERRLLEGKYQRKSAVLRAIIDATDVMLVYFDKDFNFVWVNPAYANACRKKPEELAGRNHFELYPDPENELIFRRVRQTGKPVFFKDRPFEFPDQPERGITYWDWSLVPHRNEADQVVGLVFSLRETTRYKQAQMELAASEERLRRIAETSTDIIFQTDIEGIVTYSSPALKSMGYDPVGVIGHSFSEFLPAEELSKGEDLLKKVTGGMKISLVEIQVLGADGNLVPCEISVSPVHRGGRIIGVQGIARDITERKAAEKALLESKAQLETVFDHMTEGLVMADLDGRLLRWNPSAVEIHGFQDEREYLRSLADFTDIFELAAADEGVLPLERWPLSRILQGETLNNLEIDVRRLDCDWQRTLNYGGSLARDRDGKPLLAILTLSDITERKKAEEEIRRSNRLLKGIKRIFEAGLVCGSDEELARVVLQVAEEITDSKFGFVGEIGPDGLLHDMAISDTGWEQCAMADQDGHRKPPGNFKLCGLYGHVLAEGRSLLTNEPGAHPASIGTPPGHPHLQSFLGVPFSYDGSAIGLIALANREGGYRKEHRRALEGLAPAFVETLFKTRVERALKASEAQARSHAERFKQFFDFTPMPVWIAHDPECRVITGNLSASRLLEVSPEINVSQQGEQRTPPLRVFSGGRELRPGQMPLQQAVRNKTRVDSIEIDIVTAGGKSYRMLGTAAPLLDVDGRVQGGIAAFVDISERRWMEEQLLQAKQEWEKTFDSVPDLIAILDNRHRIIRANKAMSERLGMSPGQSIGMRCFSCVHGEDKPPEDCPHVLTMRDGREHLAEVFEENLGGYFLVSTTPLFNEQGEVFATVHVARDITERKQSEEKLLESERLFKTAEKIAHFGSWQLDLDVNTMQWSDEVFRILGLEPQQFEPAYEDFLQAVHPGDRERVHTAYTRSLETGSLFYEIDHRIVRLLTGETRYVHGKCEHVRDEVGRVTSSVGMIHDITERKLAEEQIRLLNLELQNNISMLEEANRELERSNRDLQQFVNIASHDLQEPLRTVSSFMQLFRRRYHGRLDEKADTFIDFAVEGTGRMQELINDLLTFSRAGGGEMRIVPLALQDLVNGVLMTLRTAIQESGMEVIVERLPNVQGDETQLTHLLQNLISNAIKFRRAVPPRIHIFAEQKNSEVIVCVRDNGIGFDPAHAEKIFMIFQRLHSREEYSGTGIGLAICKKIVDRHNGRIWVESEPGKGSVFCFSLPDGRETDYG